MVHSQPRFRVFATCDMGKGKAGRCVQPAIDILDENHGGNPANMPYVVNKVAFR